MESERSACLSLDNYRQAVEKSGAVVEQAIVEKLRIFPIITILLPLQFQAGIYV